MDKNNSNDIIAIYESPNKYKLFKRLFEELGVKVSYAYTQGRIFDLPEGKLGIGKNGEMEFSPVSKERHRYLVDQLLSHKTVFCLTDMDDEGEWIADSVKRLCYEHAKDTTFLRLNLRELTKESLKKAIESATESLNNDAISKAHARRYVDRYIGYTENEKKLDTRGRVITPLVNSIYENPIELKKLLYIETKNLSIEASTTLSLKQVISLLSDYKEDIEKSTVVERTSIDTLPITSECLNYQLGRYEHDSSSDAFSELQDLYQNGDISYPRTENSKYYVIEGEHSGIKAVDYDDESIDGDSLLSFLKARTIFANMNATITELIPSDLLLSSLSGHGVSHLKIYKKESALDDIKKSFFMPLSMHYNTPPPTKINNISVWEKRMSKEQLILQRLCDLKIAQPSTLHLHIDNVSNLINVNDNNLSLTTKGLRVALQSDPISLSIKNIENIQKINQTLDKNGIKVEEKILECLNIINQEGMPSGQKDLSLY